MPDAGVLLVPSELLKDISARLGDLTDKEDLVSYIDELASWNTKSASVSLYRLGMSGLDVVHKVAMDRKNRRLVNQIVSLKRGLEGNFSAKIGTLDALPNLITQYLLDGLIDGWIYEEIDEGIFMPWCVQSITYERARPHYPEPDRVTMILTHNRAYKEQGRLYRKHVTFYYEDILKKSVVTLLASQNLHHENSGLKAEYLETTERFKKLVTQSGEQFWTRGAGWMSRDNSQTYEIHPIRRESYSRARVIIDETLISRHLDVHADRRYWEEVEENGQEVPEHAFSELPSDCMLYTYNLLKHEHIWYHVSQLCEYVYSPEMVEHLVLPENQTDIIDILTQDYDVLQDDIVEEKGRGSVILSKGRPGVGKTLTAEVYSEVMQRPLYRVDPAQLGSEPKDIAENLLRVLDNALRWKAVLLIDEADVYVRKRDTDRHHNEVVATFLTTLEYFDGLMFMTTNRGVDIDEAVESRCIAIIQYELPSKEMLPRMYRVHAKLAGVDLDEKLINQLIESLGEISGRDIRMLFRLVGRYVARGRGSYDLETFRKAAVFRGLSFRKPAKDRDR